MPSTSPCRTARPRRASKLSAASAGVCALVTAALSTTAPAPAGAAAATTAMIVQSQNLHQPYSWQDPRYFGVDDLLNWTVTGQIAPGDSYTYVPPWPTSSASEVPAMSASLRWTGSTTLRMTSVVPMNDQVSAADPGVDHTGQAISAPVVGSTAELCMFFVPNSSVPTFNYALTVTNVGTATATAITLTGQQSNGYTANFAPFCNRADADGDGWNDTLEEGITDLTAPAAATTSQRFAVLGVDYLGRRSATSSVDDEVDSYPPDVNDDGIVSQADVDMISSWIGQGTGLPFSRVDYSGVGPNRYQVQSGLWRRYDLNGDGLVTAADVAWVKSEVGRPVPDPVDVIAPWVGFDRSSGTSFPRRTTVWLGANARDNRALTAVRFVVNGTALTQQCTDPATEMADPATYHDPAAPEYQCLWSTPSKSGTVTVTVTATDAAGHTSSDSVTVTVS
jgi:Dockerin type I domain